VTVIGNAGVASVTLPTGDLLLASGPLLTGTDGVRTLPADTTVWLRTV
jgi:hypothetical protein